MKEKKKKDSFVDDNRTIANMDVLDGTRWHNALGHNPRKLAERKQPGKDEGPALPPELKQAPPPSPIELTRRERKAMMKAAWAFAFKIALVGFGLLALTFGIAWLWMQ